MIGCDPELDVRDPLLELVGLVELAELVELVEPVELVKLVVPAPTGRLELAWPVPLEAAACTPVVAALACDAPT